MYLEKINSPQDIKNMDIPQMQSLASEMRDALLFRLSKHGGHFGPNFGFVEATIAMHYVFNSPVDKFVFDVSHQSYCHKMLTGRKNSFLYEDKFDDISGYTNPDESEHDFFTVGHTSTSVSLACGLAKGRDLKGDKENIIAVIGDGSLSGGEALEALDYANELGTNLIIIVNDNDMSIAENHGGIYTNLKLLRETDGKAECNLFKAMGLDYVFVKDGNDLEQLIEAFNAVKDTDHPVAVHICTQKGKGYAPAEQNKEGWHWCVPFDTKTGKALYSFDGESYNAMTADFLLNKMRKDKTVAAITSGTPSVFGFTKDKRDKAGKQFIDVGIAEEHAVALASGMSKNGAKPVYGVYSTFLQRTYDQLSQDLCINNNPMTMIVFSGSVYGMSDVTHAGIFDIPFLSNIPNIVYLAPTCKEEYFAMLDWSIEQRKYPVAIRVPENGVIAGNKEVDTNYSNLNKYQITKHGSKVAIIALGSFYQTGCAASEILKSNYNIDATVINPRYITGIDTQMLEMLKTNHSIVATLEDGILDGGFGEKITRFYGSDNMKVLNFGLKKEFVDRFNVDELLKANHLTPRQIAEDIVSVSAIN